MSIATENTENTPIALPAGATLRPLELPARADAGPVPAPTDLVRRYAEVRNRSLIETTGRDHDTLPAESLLPMLYDNPDRQRRQWYVERDGELIGCCAHDVLQDDGGATAMFALALLRDHWGLGIGSAVYAHVYGVARESGVRKLQHWSEHQDDGSGLPMLSSPTGSGSVPADRAPRFLQRNGFRLDGKKSFVLHGHVADMSIVAAKTDGGITLFAVPKDAKGLTADPRRLVDSSLASHVTLDGVEVDADAVIGEVDAGGDILDALLAATRTGAAAEMVGVGQGAMDRTVTYLKERKQFGKLIGEFQALQHRAARLYTELEIAKAAVLKSLQILDEDPASAAAIVAVAKAKAGRVAQLAVQEAVQLHGGIGMTDEVDIGLFMKRARVAQELWCDSNFHADRLARLNGY